MTAFRQSACLAELDSGAASRKVATPGAAQS